MMDKWTENDERNLFITRTNILEANNEKAIDRIKEITKGKVKLENFTKRYQDKTFEIERQFKEHGLSYFSNNWTRRAVDNYFSIEMLELTEMLDIITHKIDHLCLLYLNNQTANLATKLLERLIRFYNQKAVDITNFSFENNLKDILSVILTDDRYYMYNRGDFIKFYNKMLETMTILDLKNSFFKIDDEIRPMVIDGEKRLIEFENYEKIDQARKR